MLPPSGVNTIPLSVTGWAIPPLLVAGRQNVVMVLVSAAQGFPVPPVGQHFGNAPDTGRAAASCCASSRGWSRLSRVSGLCAAATAGGFMAGRGEGGLAPPAAEPLSVVTQWRWRAASVDKSTSDVPGWLLLPPRISPISFGYGTPMVREPSRLTAVAGVPVTGARLGVASAAFLIR